MTAVATIVVTPLHPAVAQDFGAFTAPEITTLEHLGDADDDDDDDAQAGGATRARHLRVAVARTHKRHGYVATQVACLRNAAAGEVSALRARLAAAGPDLDLCALQTARSGLLVAPRLVETRPRESAAALASHPRPAAWTTRVLQDLGADDREAAGAYVARRFAFKEPMTAQLVSRGLLKVEDEENFVRSILPRVDVLRLSVVIFAGESDGTGERRRLGAALNEILDPQTPPPGSQTAHAEAASSGPSPDPAPGLGPIFALLEKQDAEGLQFCAEHLDGFAEAWAGRKVGHHFMVAGEDPQAAEAAFVASMLRFADLDFAFVVIEATNPWTATVCEKFACTAIHAEAYADHLVEDAAGEPGPIGPPELASILYLLDLRHIVGSE